jgi:hypothetical protein
VHVFDFGATKKDNAPTPPTVTMHGDLILQAQGFEYLLERRKVIGAHVRDEDDGSSKQIGWSPTFNERLQRGPSFAGNRSEEKILVAADPVTYGFGADLDGLLPYRWSLRDIIEYLLYWTNPQDGNAPDFELNGPDEPPYDLIGYMDELYEVVQQDGKNVWSLLKTLLDRQRGIGAYFAWSVDTDPDDPDYPDLPNPNYGLPKRDEKIELQVFSQSDVPASMGSYTFPANPVNERLTLDKDIDIRRAVVTVDSNNTYDRFVVEGERVVSCFSVATIPIATYFPYAECEPAWTSADETAYKNETETTGPDGQPVSADTHRNSDRYARVYRQFRLPTGFNWQDANGHRLNPLIWRYGQIDFLNDAPAWNRTHRLLDWLPIRDPAGVTAESPEPQMSKPLAVVEEIDSEGENTQRWHLSHVLPYLLRSDYPQVGTGGKLTMHDRESLFEVKFAPGHVLGLNHFDPAVSETDVAPVFDYERMIATIAVETDTRAKIEVEVLVPGRDLDRVLQIRVPDAHVWLVAPTTVVGVNDDGTLKYYESPNNPYLTDPRVARTDIHRLFRIALLARAMHGKRRAAVKVTRQGLALSHQLGTMLEAVVTQQNVQEVNSPVTRRSWDFEKCTSEVETNFLALDTRTVR